MIPKKEDPRWKELVTMGTSLPLHGLATKMLLMRVRTMIKLDSSPEKIDEAIKITYDFFNKNEETLKNDLEIIFRSNDENTI